MTETIRGAADDRCPGPEHAATCANMACRRHGCQGGGRRHHPAAAGAVAAPHDHGAVEAARHGVARSPHWPAVERQFRAAHPSCLHCPPGRRAAVNVHHVWPFHIVVMLGRPDLELDHRNLVTLCRDGDDSHLLIGHLDDFRSYNPDVLQDAAVTFHGLAAAAIKADPRWIAKDHARPLDELADADKAAILALLNQRFPLLPVKQAA